EPEHGDAGEPGEHVVRIGAVDVGDDEIGMWTARFRDHLVAACDQHGVDLAAEEQVHTGELNDAHSDSVTWLTQPFRMNVRSKNTSRPAATRITPLANRTTSYWSRIHRNADIVRPSATAAS